MTQRYQTIDLNFEYHSFAAAGAMDRFIASVSLPRRVQRTLVDMRPVATPYMVVTCDETEEARDNRLAVTE